MARNCRVYSNVFVKPNEQSQVFLSYAMARNCRVYSNFHCLFCAKIRKSSDIYDKYGHFFTVSSILQRILFVFSQINPLLSPRTLPRHLVCRRKCLSVFQHCRRPAHEGLRLFPRERIFSLSRGKNIFLAREEKICLVCTQPFPCPRNLWLAKLSQSLFQIKPVARLLGGHDVSVSVHFVSLRGLT